MPTIKVTYNTTIRRFSISEKITWSELESKILKIFSLPPSFEFSLRYTDEDGDVITLASDIELEDLLPTLSSQPVLKFTLIPALFDDRCETFSISASESDFISIDDKLNFADNVSEKSDNYFVYPLSTSEEEPAVETATIRQQQEEILESAENVQQQQEQQEQQEESHETEQEEENHETEQQEEENHETEQQEEENYETEQQEEENHEREQQEEENHETEQKDTPPVELALQFQELIDQSKDFLETNPQLFEQANLIMGEILQNIPIDIEEWAELLQKTVNEGNTQAPSPFSSPRALLSNPFIQQIAKDIRKFATPPPTQRRRGSRQS